MNFIDLRQVNYCYDEVSYIKKRSLFGAALLFAMSQIVVKFLLPPSLRHASNHFHYTSNLVPLKSRYSRQISKNPVNSIDTVEDLKTDP